MYHGSYTFVPPIPKMTNANAQAAAANAKATAAAEDIRKGALQRAFLVSRGIPWQAIEDMGVVYRGVMVEAFEEVERQAVEKQAKARSVPAPQPENDDPQGIDYV